MFPLTFLFPIIFLGVSESDSITKPPIYYNSSSETFKLVLFSDVHFAESTEKDTNTTKVITDILKWEHPDFVVFTGDMITGKALIAPNSSAYIDKLVTPLVEGNYNWASTYGNHDSSILASREEIFKAEQKYENSYTQNMDPNLPGITNYYIPIYSDVKNNSKPSFILWFFDSRGGVSQNNEPITAHVDSAVVEWFTKESENFKSKFGPVPSYVYFHHPTKEYKTVHEELHLRPDCSGIRNDTVTPQTKDTEILKALASTGMVKAVFIGHNHGQGWCCNYGTIVLCYNRHSGYGGVRMPGLRGARIVEISTTRPWAQFTSYIRLEDGTVVDIFPNESSN